jgi:small ligand-binding sensory domain FIST
MSQKGEIISFSEKWMELEITILSQISHTQEKSIAFSLYTESRSMCVCIGCESRGVVTGKER